MAANRIWQQLFGEGIVRSVDYFGLRGERPIFISSYTGKEALFFYLAGGLMRLAGESLFSLRLTAAFTGILTVAATYWLGHEMLADRRQALLADLFLSGYLGIDHAVQGTRNYRLLDAKVEFHRDLPLAGDTIRYDIHIDKPFGGAEMAGIKLHAPIDTLISHNRIHHCNRGLWMDWNGWEISCLIQPCCSFLEWCLPGASPPTFLPLSSARQFRGRVSPFGSQIC